MATAGAANLREPEPEALLAGCGGMDAFGPGIGTVDGAVVANRELEVAPVVKERVGAGQQRHERAGRRNQPRLLVQLPGLQRSTGGVRVRACERARA